MIEEKKLLTTVKASAYFGLDFTIIPYDIKSDAASILLIRAVDSGSWGRTIPFIEFKPNSMILDVCVHCEGKELCLSTPGPLRQQNENRVSVKLLSDGTFSIDV